MEANYDYNDRCMKCGGKEAEHSTQRQHNFEPDPREPLVQEVIELVRRFDENSLADVGYVVAAARKLARWTP